MYYVLKPQSRQIITRNASLQGYYDTADSGVRDEKGYIAVMGRTDDVINVASRRVSASAIEEVRHTRILSLLAAAKPLLIDLNTSCGINMCI